MIKVCIIIINYNSWADTIGCLESVLRNSYVEYQIVVVDNNSPNRSMDYLKAWAEGKLNVWINPDNPLRSLSYPPVFKPIPYVYYTREEAEKGGDSEKEKDLKKLSRNHNSINMQYPLVFVQSRKNLGFGGGNNVGIKYAIKCDADCILLLNNDTIVDKDFLDKMVEIDEDGPNIGIIGPKILNIDGTQQTSFWKFHSYLNVFSHAILFNLFGNFYKYRKPSGLMDVDVVCGACMLLKMKVFEDIGLFDENFFLYSEETDICYRAKRKNYKIIHYSESNIVHFGARSSTKLSKIAVLNSYKSKIYFFHKHFGEIKASILEKFLIIGLYERMFLLMLKNMISRDKTSTQYVNNMKEVLIWYNHIYKQNIKRCTDEI